MNPEPAYPDEQVALMNLLSAPADYNLNPYGAGDYGGDNGIPTVEVGITTPDDLEAKLPYVQVERITTTDDGTNNNPNVAVTAYAASYSVGMGLATEIQQRILACPHQVGSIILDRGTTRTGPAERPYSPNVRQFPATYRITARR